MSVSRSHVKSIPAKQTLKDGQYTLHGAAWGAPVTRVEVRFDQDPWVGASIDEGQQ